MKPIYVSLSFLALAISLPPARAQIVAEPNGTGTEVTRSGNQFNIGGGRRSRDGANLFHRFEKFGVPRDQIANFLSNPATRNILGQVVGGDPSIINGLIKVSGGNTNLFLINPAGVLFGANASLDVSAAFTATTANDVGFGSQWLNAAGANTYADLIGNPTAFAFTGSTPGAIVNAGDLAVKPGQNLTLMGGTVINTGQLTAPEGGQITIAAVPGEKLVRLSQDGHLLSLEFQPLSVAGTLPQDWTLPIASLPDLLAGGDMRHATRLSINSDNQVVLAGSGLRVSPENGTVIASGTLDASSTAPGQIGGSVLVLGEKVGLVDANINVSGTDGGGTVLVGGNYKGQGTLPTAQQTFINQDSVIAADALTNGDGGRIIAWADETTTFRGMISARGGEESGNGGFVEVSGKENLLFRGTVDLSAEQGDFGSLFLDPENIYIVAGDGGTDNDDNEVIDFQILASDPGETFTISENQLESLDGDTNLTLEATNNIEIKSLIDNELSFLFGSGLIQFIAGGSFVMQDTGTIDTDGRNIEISGSNISVGNITANAGEITLFAKTANLVAGNLDSGGEAGGDITLMAPDGTIVAESITTEGKVDITGVSTNITFDIYASNDINIKSTAGDIHAERIESSNAIILDAAVGENVDGGNIKIGTIDSNGGQITLTAQKDIWISNDIDSDGGQIILTAQGDIDTFDIDSDGGQITLTAQRDVETFGIESNNGLITINSNDRIDVIDLIDSSGGDISLSAGSFVRVYDIKSNGGAIFLNSGNDILLRDNINSEGEFGRGGNINIKAGGDILFEPSSTARNDILSDGGAISFQAGNNISLEIENFSSGSDGPILLESGGNILLDSSSDLNFTNAQFRSGGDTNIIADTIYWRDESFNPLIIQAQGDISLEGASILVESSEDSPQQWFQSGGNITLISDDEINTNVFFATDGTFTATVHDQALAFNTISIDISSRISSTGDVNLDSDYIGPALKIEAQGSITGQNITITEPGQLIGLDTNTINVAFDSDTAFLATSPALILRSGVENISPTLVPGSPITRGGTVITTSASSSAPANIQTGDITTSTRTLNGPAIISTTGNIQTGSIKTGNGLIETNSTISLAERGGLVNLLTTAPDSSILIEGDIFTSGIGFGGHIRLDSVGEIQVNGGIDSSSFLSRGDDQELIDDNSVSLSGELQAFGVQGGDIFIVSEGSNIFVEYINSNGLNSSIDPDVDGGQAGDITVSSPNGLFRVTGFVPSSIALSATIEPSENTVSILSAGSTPPDNAFRGGMIEIESGGQFVTGVTFDDSIGPLDTNNIAITPASDSFEFNEGQGGTAGAIISRNSNGVDRAAHINSLLEPGTSTSGLSIGDKNNIQIQITTTELPDSGNMDDLGNTNDLGNTSDLSNMDDLSSMGDSGDTSDSSNTSDSGNMDSSGSSMGDSGNTSDSSNTSDSGNMDSSGSSMGDSGNTSDSGDTSGSGDTSDAGDSGDTTENRTLDQTESTSDDQTNDVVSEGRSEEVEEELCQPFYGGNDVLNLSDVAPPECSK